MKNPWEKIRLDDYENHMSLNSVKQLQTLNMIMKEQFDAYPVESAMVLGVAGGNGLEHINTDKYRIVYGVDVNENYLRTVERRHSQLNALKCLCIDLMKDASFLPQAQLLIANLLIEYIGYAAFQNVVLQTRPQYVSSVIQINTDTVNWVSDSPYIHKFDCLDEVHQQMDGEKLTVVMKEIGYSKILEKSEPLPNGKLFLRIDFQHLS